MTTKRSIVLLSSGMDSTTALYKALNVSDVRAVMCFQYGQKGAEHEIAGARKIFENLPHHNFDWRVKQDFDGMDFLVSTFEMNAVSALFNNSPLKTYPGSTHWSRYGQESLPATFVPARNLIMLSLAAATAWTLGCTEIWGGWSAFDVDYPDCSSQFLHFAEDAINSALGLYNQSPRIHIMAPLINKSKVETIQMGEKLGVPWELTRSCYEGDEEPCLICDSCLLRANAFMQADLVDPTINPRDWELLRDEYEGG